ncbi:MAG: YjgN family protein, partial [Beijerinckiaceae bacterium]|nr:YjgN family protein [Beijerinckiaceae bacterium]
FALYRARRYRLTRTIWRGVRFWMDGSGWKYAFLSFGWLVLTVLTLGLLYPWRAAALERYKMRHTHYGSIQGSFEATGWQFFKVGVWLWLIALLPIIGILTSLVQIGSQGYIASLDLSRFSGLLWFSGLAFFLLPFLWPFFQAIEWRWWARGVNIGGVRLTSKIRGGQLLGLYLKLLFAAFLMTIALSIVGGIVYAIAGTVLQSIYGISVSTLMQIVISKYPFAGIVVAIISYLIAGLAFGVIQRYFLQYRFWALIVSALELHNIHALDGAIAKGDLAGALGEGLADGLDVGGF